MVNFRSCDFVLEVLLSPRVSVDEEIFESERVCAVDVPLLGGRWAIVTKDDAEFLKNSIASGTFGGVEASQNLTGMDTKKMRGRFLSVRHNLGVYTANFECIQGGRQALILWAPPKLGLGSSGATLFE